MKRLEGRVALITGGASGIGLATARLFVEEGARVVIAARDALRGDKAIAEIDPGGAGLAQFITCDVAHSEECRRAVEGAVERFGRLDILLNNAGVSYVGRSVIDTSEDEWRETLDVNLTGAFWMSHYAIPYMVRQGGGSIIHMASIFGLVGGRGVAAYCAAKGGLIALTRAMALDHAPQNIRVNCVCPGSVDTPLLQAEMEALGGAADQRPKFAARHPLNRISSPEEIARAVLFLASDEASFITGAVLPVDGGRSAQ